MTHKPRRARALLMLLALYTGVALAAPTAASVSQACDAAGFQQVLHAIPAQAQRVDARAHWLDRRLIRWPGVVTGDGQRMQLYHSAGGTIVARHGARVAGADGALALEAYDGEIPAALAERFRFLESGTTLAVRDEDAARLPSLHTGQLLLVHEDADGRVREATALQVAGALDDLYAAAEGIDDFGATVGFDGTRFRLWAPTARAVSVCLHRDDRAPADAVHPLRRDAATGVWSRSLPRDLSGRYYTYVIDVFVRDMGVVRNRVTDPYSTGLGADSRRSVAVDLDAPALKPDGWDAAAAPAIAAQTDMTIYELHVRDFSRDDASVSEANRGKYLAFTESGSDGMRHLRTLAGAGLTDVHLLPVFDLASVPETGCVSPAIPDAAPDSPAQQAAVMAVAARDCFNWGYDPFHFNAPEGSFASDAADGAARILEFRRMVMALHAAGLRVGMDVVYNHTSASGQHPQSVLDRIVPGYYHRYDAAGRVERSTCCDNTATEHRMMAKLMIDSAVLWARHYRIDSFRFDLMGHQPRAAMERLQAAVDAAAGRRIHLIGEGWNFGEVADGARFVQASQQSLAGSGIGTFSDRTRDAVRGGGPADRGRALLTEQGWINGLVYDRNPHAPERPLEELKRSADLVRVGLAGTLRDYTMSAHDGTRKTLAEIDYKGQPAGYAVQPDEVVNYVENHDNQTLFDINVFKLPPDTSREDRARVQMLGAAVTAFSQGIAYFHAGLETLRSKSLDRNSYDSGDWFNRLDWTLRDNHFGSGLPPAQDNREDWPLMQPLLSHPDIEPGPEQIRLARDMFLDLLRIRASTPLFRLRSADEITRRLTFPNGGPAQNPRVIAGRLDGAGLADAGFAEVLYFINVDPAAQTLELSGLRGRDWTLHPVHRAPDAADPRPAAQAHYDRASGRFTLPGRTALAYVIERAP
ncbi:pullulanase-type alpha-1,6-glucosidase [Luteimonas suaedae]|uniref:pullulanase-type alpha-1,6-glucosidase n=1 Tax=Luteimonas suaedae TaxID=2605430 RepID=UPI002103FDB9|nr:pullulanase-type alpha-1,6-glucosidase [Luteimonas suaedae]